MKKRLVISCMLLIAASASSADEATAAPERRSPGDMTVDERRGMMEHAQNYNNCVFNLAMQRVNSDPDIRRIADLAMDDCQNNLDALQDQIIAWGFPDYFAEGFTRTVRDRAARKLIPELAISKSR